MREYYVSFQKSLDYLYRFDQRFPVCNDMSFIDIMRPLWLSWFLFCLIGENVFVE